VAMVAVTLLTDEPSRKSLAPFFDISDGGSETSAKRERE
jgi:hypothetical protein